MAQSGFRLCITPLQTSSYFVMHPTYRESTTPVVELDVGDISPPTTFPSSERLNSAYKYTVAMSMSTESHGTHRTNVWVVAWVTRQMQGQGLTRARRKKKSPVKSCHHPKQPPLPFPPLQQTNYPLGSE